jgi:hypothetical protein
VEAWPALAPFLSDRRWEMIEDDRGEDRAFHGFASRHHPRRRAFRAGHGGLLRLALSDGPVTLVVASPDAPGADSFAAELHRYTRVFARSPGQVSILLEPGRPGWRMDPGLTLGMATQTASWTALCVRFSKTPLGLLLATHAYLWLREGSHTSFARLHVEADSQCIFCGHLAARDCDHSTRVQAVDCEPEPLRVGCAGTFL